MFTNLTLFLDVYEVCLHTILTRTHILPIVLLINRLTANTK